MKKIFIPFVAALALAVLPGCQKEFEQIVPNGGSLSPEQVQAGATLSPERANAGLVGLFSMYNQYNLFYARQSDFGYPSLAQYLEEAGDNVVSTTHGYNWFGGGLKHDGFQTKNSQPSGYAWNAGYKNIKLANDIISQMKGGEADANIAHALGNAYAMRAWDYFMLVQLFGKTYFGNEDTPGVVIVTEETPLDQLTNNPRVSVREVYDLILSDLDNAATLLKGYNPIKSQISEAVVYGIRARVNLTMHKFAEAAADAKMAIETFPGQPLSLNEVAIPTFDDVAAGASSMWGIIITDKDDVTQTGIANWTSMFTSLLWGSGGYTTMVGTYKMMNSRVYNLIPESDIRRGWWGTPRLLGQDAGGNIFVTDNREEAVAMGISSPAIERAYPDDAGWMAYEYRNYPYVVFKFAPNDKDIYSEINAVDFQLMRVEEMYYILAEAQAKAGDLAAGTKTLNDFVKTYRDPGFNRTFASADALADEIYFQKRIEFWGEGIVWFDMVRLHKGINRVDVAAGDNGGYPESTRYNIPDGDPMFLWQIPESEEQSNAAIAGNNNPAAVPPQDMM